MSPFATASTTAALRLAGHLWSGLGVINAGVAIIGLLYKPMVVRRGVGVARSLRAAVIYRESATLTRDKPSRT